MGVAVSLSENHTSHLGRGWGRLEGSHGVNQIPVVDIVPRLRDGEVFMVFLQPLPSKSVSRDAKTTELICLHT